MLNLADIKPEGGYFAMTSFAFGVDGVVYADEITGGQAFEQHQQLIADRVGRIMPLWQELDTP